MTLKRKIRLEKNALRLFVCFSGNASAIQCIENDDTGWKSTYEVVGTLTDKQDAPGISFFEEHSIPCEYINRTDIKKNDVYLTEAMHLINRYNPDYIVFSGFMRIVPDWFIRNFEGKIINVHPTDLNILDATGKRKYTGRGRDAIQKVLDDGLETIRSTIHYIEEGAVDGGEIIAQSQFCKIAPRDTAETLHKRLKSIAEWQALQYALQILYKQQLIPA